MRPRRFAPATVLLIQVVEDTRQRIGLDLEPPDALIAPPPAQLASRVAAVGSRHRIRKLLERQLAPNVGERLCVADACEHWRSRRHSVVEGSQGLVNEATLDLAAAALFEARIDDV